MGRAGGGSGRSGGSGGFSGGGHSSFSHSGGGHRVSSSFGSSRPTGTFAKSTRSSTSSIPNNPPPPTGFYGPRVGPTIWRSSFSRRAAPPPIVTDVGGGFGYRGCAGAGCMGGGCATVFAIVVIITSVVIFLTFIGGGLSLGGGYSSPDEQSVPVSSYNREKLENTSWSNDCVIDEIGWISEDGSISGLEKQLRKFYDLTGIQPFVYLKSYDSGLITDADKEAFASQFYETQINNSYTFVYFYFEEENPNDVGYMYYEGGSDALGIMDSEAIDIFWTIVDQEWYSDNSTEDCLANIFVRTANRIMTKTTTANDIKKVIAVIVLVIVIAIVIIIIMNKRRKNEKERNEERRRILETPLE